MFNNLFQFLIFFDISIICFYMIYNFSFWPAMADEIPFDGVPKPDNWDDWWFQKCEATNGQPVKSNDQCMLPCSLRKSYSNWVIPVELYGLVMGTAEADPGRVWCLLLIYVVRFLAGSNSQQHLDQRWTWWMPGDASVKHLGEQRIGSSNETHIMYVYIERTNQAQLYHFHPR